MSTLNYTIIDSRSKNNFQFQSLYEEMILNGVIRKYPKVRLSDFYGGISYTASKLKNNPGRDPNPGGGDIRRAIAEYCILPMCEYQIYDIFKLSNQFK